MRKILIKQFDDFIFRQLDAAKESQLRLKINETLNSLSEHQLKILSQTSSYVFIALPLFALMIMSISNSILRSKIELKEQILTEVEYYTSKKSEVETVGRRIISPHQINNKGALITRLKRLAQRKSIDTNSINVLSFEALEKSGNISKSEATIKISKFTSKNLSDYILGLLQSEKVKIFEISLKRDNKKELISGVVKFTHYGKAGK
ncbi:hypothetical protein A9Q84_11755 [Halobacteriovorax marinus]|uniref:General secretion pathway protein M n=1 Tax=Halobacteriovorax marinus TaxID=97084 RepID=A0A1Y5F7Z7_9BACT|nr:hypothetical protein A9Q84_11755 [Halobacteriovorax marinus]